MEYTKEEFYKMFIDIQKKHGQGLSGIIPYKAHYLKEYLDEWIDAGLVVKMTISTSSLGISESNDFYMPTKGYNVWKDSYDNTGNYNSYLYNVRAYLGIKEEGFFSGFNVDKNSDDYKKWLKRNEKELELMISLSDELGEIDLFNEFEKEIIKNSKFYDENYNVSETIKNTQKILDISKQVLNLKKRLKDITDDKIKLLNISKDIDELNIDIKLRSKLYRWLNTITDKNSIVSDIIKL